MAIFWALMLNFSQSVPEGASYFLSQMSQVGITINLILMVLNLLPLPPLDGGRIAVSLLPMDLAVKLSRVEQYGFIILVVLLFTGVLGRVIWPIISFLQQMLLNIFV